jgi:hypothetical protein
MRAWAWPSAAHDSQQGINKAILMALALLAAT